MRGKERGSKLVRRVSYLGGVRSKPCRVSEVGGRASKLLRGYKLLKRCEWEKKED